MSQMISDVFESYSGRDRVIRTVSYGSMFLSGLLPGSASYKCQIIAGQLSAARVVLRLFDDLPMWLYTRRYGFGKEEKVPILSALGVLNNVVDQLYYPLEHFAWAGDHKLLPVNSKRFWSLSIIAWGISLFLGIIRGLLKLYGIKLKKEKVLKQKKMNALEGSANDFDSKLKKLAYEEHTVVIDVLRRLFDITNAINWMPVGFLWAGRLSVTKSGFYGLLSSLLMMYQLIREKHVQ